MSSYRENTRLLGSIVPKSSSYESLATSPGKKPKHVISSLRYTNAAPSESSSLRRLSGARSVRERSEEQGEHAGSLLTSTGEHVDKTFYFEGSILEEDGSQLTVWQRLHYYLPCFAWLPGYDGHKLLRDAVAGASLASFQIPLALSFATSIAHVSGLCGLYALGVPPLVYGVLGSVPQLICGPESAISLVVGEAVQKIVSHDDAVDPVDLVSVMSCVGGFYLLGAGLCRFGFLDNVLSRALLRGFITCVALIMIINSLYDELGLKGHIHIPGHLHSPIDKLCFLLGNVRRYHGPTSAISGAGIAVLVLLTLAKHRLVAAGYRRTMFFPEIMVLVVGSTCLSRYCRWDLLGVEIVGEIKTAGFSFKSPFSRDLLALYHPVMSAGLLAATLGFFESTTASKSLGSAYELEISSNRELVALGAMNIVGSFCGALPAFGGYGRSKINALSGAQTTLSGAIMGLITLFTIFYLLPFIHHLPICMLSVITTSVGVRLLEETPTDILFHIRSKGYSELLTFCITVVVTMLDSLDAGILVGVAFSVIRVIKHSTKSRIQILGRLPNTNIFINSDEPLPENFNDSEFLEEVEGCLIVKVTEPLTFSNASDLKLRLLRLERYGSSKTHPGKPRTRLESMNRYVLFDLNGMTYFDSSAAQIFYETLLAYRKRNIDIYLIRVPTTRAIRERLYNSGIMGLVKDQKFYSSIEEVLQVIDEHEVLQSLYSESV